MVEKSNKQKADQTYLNDLANKLRVAEREAIHLADINYQPSTNKVTKPRERSIQLKFDKNEVKRVAQATRLPEHIVQTICVQKNWTPQQFLESLNVAVTQSESPKENNSTNSSEMK